MDGLGNKKSYKQNLSHITKSKLEAKKDELLKATSDKDSELNKVFPQIFKSYLNKPFRAFKSITKTNVLEFKKLLLNEHPTLVKIRAKELEYKNQIEQNKLIAKANNESAENVRIKNWKLVYPGISINEIPKFATVDLLSLEQAMLLKEQEIKAKEAEQLRKASILSKDELKAKKN